MSTMMKSSPKYGFQSEAREFFKGKNQIGGFVFYGGGKTYLSLQWIADNLELGHVMLPVLVVCPNNLVYQWADQIRMHSHFTCVVIDGSLRERREALKKNVDIYIVNYAAIRSGLRADLNLLGARCRTIIADESTYLKSAKTTRFKLCQYNFCNIPNRAILTGKPITEKPQDIWSQMLFLDGGKRLGTSWFAFMNEYYKKVPFVPMGTFEQEGAGKRLADKIADCCVYIPRERVAEQLPPRLEIPIKFELPPDVRKQYEELKRNYRLEFESGAKIDTQWAIVKAQKLHQMCNGFVNATGDDDELAVQRLATHKFDWVSDSVEEILAQGPLLLWGYHRQTVQDLCDVMDKKKVRYGRYMGGDTQDGITAFQNGKLDTLVLSVRAAYSGFNLFRAKSAVFVSQGYSGDMRDNSIHRNYRSGSEMHDQVFLYDHITDGTVEEAIFKAVNEKASVSDAILQHLIS